MSGFDDEERIEDEETEPGVSGVPPLDISQRHTLTKLQKRKVGIFNEFEKNVGAALFMWELHEFEKNEERSS